MRQVKSILSVEVLNEPGPALQNPAVAHCCDSFVRAFQEELRIEGNDLNAEPFAQEAYRNAMPPLCGKQNITNFIACVAHGILLKIFHPEEASRLLAASRIAWSTIPRPKINPGPKAGKAVPGTRKPRK